MDAAHIDHLVNEAEDAGKQREFETAKQRYEALLTLVGDGEPVSRVLAGFGWVLQALGDYHAALAHHEQALRVIDRVYPGDEGKRSVALSGIGAALLKLSRPGEALDMFRTVLTYGITGRIRAVALNRASEAAAASGLADEARSYLIDSVAILQTLLAEQPLVDDDLEIAVWKATGALMEREQQDEAHRLLRLLYARQSFRTTRKRPEPDGTLLVLSSWDGNVPDEHLLQRLNMNIVKWMLEFGDEEHERRLPPYHVVLNVVGDADQGAAALAKVAEFERRTQAPFLNRAAHILRTRRDRIGLLFEGIDGLVIPHCVRLSQSERARLAPDLALAQSALRVPVLLREAGRHGGETVRRLDTDEAFAQAWQEGSGDAYLTEYRDYASPDGFYRKYRVIFVDRQPFPYHLAISPHWLVHYFSADMIEHDAKREEELRFLADMDGVLGPRAVAALHEVGHRLDLGYGGIDFSLLPDGRILLFEANATMLVHPEDKDGVLATKNPFIDHIFDAFDRTVTGCLPTHQASPEGGCWRARKDSNFQPPDS